MLKSLNVSLIMIEPSLIFCMLSPTNKLLALKNGFVPSKVEGFNDVISLAVLEDDFKILEKEETIEKLLSSGFQIFRTRKWSNTSEKSSDHFNFKSDSLDPFYTSHYLIYQYHLIFHIIILYRRGTFLWHAGLFKDDLGFKDLLFVQAGAYENFTAVPLKSDQELGIYLPSDPFQFLLQLQNAEFRECLPHFLNLFPLSSAPIHPLLTDEQLQLRVLIIIQELKTRLWPYNVSFWIWSKTLLGWYYKCNIFEYTKRLHLAFPSDINTANLIPIFSNNEYWTLDEIIELDGQYLELRLDCHSLKIHVYIIHKEDNNIWYQINDQGQNKAIRYMSPKCDLCSTDLYGQKIHVPCEPKGILDAELVSNGTSLTTSE
ncbi:fukutin-like [Stegodyphus dumicola]|uniref:fukutin-like n=1 Tax=Stegodyphus dumicola TaxID=202533 RepID=UPI0015AF0AC2|nr:fukutin-like [Stegodyphus dumicola]